MGTDPTEPTEEEFDIITEDEVTEVETSEDPQTEDGKSL